MESIKLFIQKGLVNQTSLLKNQKSVTNHQEMAENFNDFFTSIEKNHQEIISLARKHAQDLKTPIKNNFLIKSTKHLRH